MAGLLGYVAAANRALSLCLGVGVLAAAAAAAASLGEPMAILAWSRQVLGGVFVALYLGLVFVAVYAWARLGDDDARVAGFWRAAGLHAANGVATLALTFTLYGISAGIASLTGQELSPATVTAVIAELTAHFSQAFMTTVVGLPSAAVLRALILLSYRSRHEEGPCAS
jgi:hypothetical protein